ncbi:hypothetical protein JW859_13800 [bacterium]|nr:hypothetical protein [bacterium]
MRFYLILLISLLVVLLIGCQGGSVPLAGPTSELQPETAADTPGDSLPALADIDQYVRHSQILDGDTVQGSFAVNAHNWSPSATRGLLMIPESEHLAFAVYGIPSRATPPDYFTYNTSWYDGDPLVTSPNDGFWVAYADFAQDCWVFTGPYSSSQTRIAVPAQADVISPGDNLFVAVIMLQGNALIINSVSAGYYTTEGYEEVYLAPPQGKRVSHGIDIQLDPAGNPQIAYLVNDSIYTTYGNQLRIASLTDGEWTLEPESTPYTIWDIMFRIGDNGRRAILAATSTSGELHLLYDGGSGEFTGDYLITTEHNSANRPAMSFFNADGDPSGDRDDLMIVYEEEDAWPDFYVRSCRYDGTNPPVIENVYPGSLAQVGCPSLTTNADNSLLLGYLVEMVVDEPFLDTQSYTTGGGWANSGFVDWVDIDPEDDFVFRPGISTVELPDHSLAAAWIHEGNHGIVLGHSTAMGWDSTPTDTIGCDAPSIIDLEVYPDGDVGFLADYADYRLQLFRKQPGVNEAVQVTAIDNSVTDSGYGTMAVDADGVTHIATCSVEGSGLLYYTVDESGVSEPAVVDALGWSQGASGGMPVMVALGDDLYVFDWDRAHCTLMYSLNRTGSWIVENGTIPTDPPCMSTVAAGYLAESNLIYVVYQESINETINIVSFTPDGTDYQSNELIPYISELPAIDDDETNVGALYLKSTLYGTDRLVFSLGPPRTAPNQEEIVTSEASLTDPPYKLEYNTVRQTWLAGSHGDDINSCLVHTRTPEGYWTGPQLVTSQPGTAYVAIGGIEHDHVTGCNYVVVYEQPDGDTWRQVNVYADNNALGLFEYINYVMEYDTANYDMSSVVTAPNAHGWPWISLMIKPNTQLTWNFRVMEPVTSFAWNSAFTWETEYIQPVGNQMMVVLGNGLPALALLEGYQANEDDYGRVLVRYPW